MIPKQERIDGFGQFLCEVPVDYRVNYGQKPALPDISKSYLAVSNVIVDHHANIRSSMRTNQSKPPDPANRWQEWCSTKCPENKDNSPLP